MFTSKRHKIPSTIDQAAELLMDDLNINHVKTLAGASDNDFELICTELIPVLNEEFRIWLDNTSLLESCLKYDLCPARAILNRVREYCLLYIGG